MQIYQMAEQCNDHQDDHAMIPPGTRPAKSGAIWLVGGYQSSYPQGSLVDTDVFVPYVLKLKL